MTDQEIATVYKSAQAEFNQGEQAMLISPLILIAIIERLERAEEKIEAAELYDQLH